MSRKRKPITPIPETEPPRIIHLELTEKQVKALLQIVRNPPLSGNMLSLLPVIEAMTELREIFAKALESPS